MTKEWECPECHQINTFNRLGYMGICIGCGRMGNEQAEVESQKLISKYKRLIRRQSNDNCKKRS